MNLTWTQAGIMTGMVFVAMFMATKTLPDEPSNWFIYLSIVGVFFIRSILTGWRLTHFRTWSPALAALVAEAVVVGGYILVVLLIGADLITLGTYTQPALRALVFTAGFMEVIQFPYRLSPSSKEVVIPPKDVPTPLDTHPQGERS